MSVNHSRPLSISSIIDRRRWGVRSRAAAGVSVSARCRCQCHCRYPLHPSIYIVSTRPTSTNTPGNPRERGRRHDHDHLERLHGDEMKVKACRLLHAGASSIAIVIALVIVGSFPPFSNLLFLLHTDSYEGPNTRLQPPPTMNANIDVTGYLRTNQSFQTSF